MQQADFRSPRVFFERYLADFLGIGLDWDDDWKDWTRKNLGYFAELGESQNFKVWSQHAERKGEYLVDLCWLVSGGQYYWMELAMEEEWHVSRDEIDEDFFKLMDVKAYLKVFMCFAPEAIRSDLPSWLAQAISRHRIKIPEEAYLLIIFSRNERRKQAERLEVEGFGIDYRGNITPLGEKYFPDRMEDV